jgi:hypothetical protein
MFENPDLPLFVWVFAASSVVVGLIWFLFVAPAERRYHQRKLEAVQEQIRRREVSLKNTDTHATGSDDHAQS